MEKYTELEHNCLKQTIISYQLTFRNKFYYQIAVVVKQTTSYNVLHVCGIILKKEDDTKSIYVLFMIFDPRSSVLALPVFFYPFRLCFINGNSNERNDQKTKKKQTKAERPKRSMVGLGWGLLEALFVHVYYFSMSDTNYH